MSRFSCGWNQRALWSGRGVHEPKPWKIHAQASNSTGLGCTQIQPPRGVKHQELAQTTQRRCWLAWFPAVPTRPDPSHPPPPQVMPAVFLPRLTHPVSTRCLRGPHRRLPTLRLLLRKEYLKKIYTCRISLPRAALYASRTII